jgi:hypothetical protein
MSPAAWSECLSGCIRISFSPTRCSSREDEVLLLPAKTRYEQDDGGTETSTERRVMFSPELPRPDGMWEKPARNGRSCGTRGTDYPERAHLLGCEDGWKMREEIARIVPMYEGSSISK